MVELSLVLLFATWAFVIPYLVMYPPALSMLRLRRQRLNKLRSMTLPVDCFDSSNPALAARIKKLPGRARPVLVFVNTKSGGQCGAALLRCFKSVIAPDQVFDMSIVKPSDVFAHLRSTGINTGNMRVAVCGGDGSVGWVLEAADAAKVSIPVSIMPLGTGNDLARSLRWGGGVSSRDVSNDFVTDFLLQTYDAEVRDLDQWEVVILSPDGKETKRVTMNNYFSFGIDASIALKFHEERQRHPDRFSSQQKNVVKYAFYGFEGAFEGVPLEDSVTMTGLQPLPNGRQKEVEIPINPHWKGLIVSNVPCYHGGKNFWGEADGDSFLPASTEDQMLEVMGLSGTLHIGLVNLAMDNSLRLAQVRGVQVVLTEPTPMQIDGEPWIQEPCTIKCSFRRKFPMLLGTNS